MARTPQRSELNYVFLHQNKTYFNLMMLRGFFGQAQTVQVLIELNGSTGVRY